MATRTICFVGQDPEIWSVVDALGRSQGIATERVDAFEQLLEHQDLLESGCLLIDTDYWQEAPEVLPRHLRLARILLPLIVLASHAGLEVAVRCMKCGAADFLQKPCSQQALSEALVAALRRDEMEYQLRCVHQQFLRNFEKLAPAEREVLDRMTRGLPNKQIAAELGIGLRTAELRRARVLEKMQAGSLAELVRMVTTAELVGQWLLWMETQP